MGVQNEPTTFTQLCLSPEMEILEAKFEEIPQVPAPSNPALKQVVETQKNRPPIIFSRGT